MGAEWGAAVAAVDRLFFPEQPHMAPDSHGRSVTLQKLAMMEEGVVGCHRGEGHMQRGALITGDIGDMYMALCALRCDTASLNSAADYKAPPKEKSGRNKSGEQGVTILQMDYVAVSDKHTISSQLVIE